MLATLLAVCCAGWARAADADWAAIEAGDKKVGKLNLYPTCLPGDEGLIAAFEAAYPGIKVETVRLGSGAMMQRFEAETAAAPARPMRS